jgi:hypothetical protein
LIGQALLQDCLVLPAYCEKTYPFYHQQTFQMNSSAFYMVWKGHEPEQLTKLHSIIRAERAGKPVIFLAGDSSLDNKYWVQRSDLNDSNVKTPDIYNIAFKDNDRRPKPDVAFWLNVAMGDRAGTINCAIEESMLRERDTKLLPQDEFIRDNIQADDVLIVSVGGNDIALRPNVATVRRLLQLAYFTPKSSLESGKAWAYSYFNNMFKGQVESYVSRLVEKQKPRAIIVCMIYYPLESSASTQDSWADTPLSWLKYSSDPERLQMAIKKMYEMATTKIQIEGVEVIPCPLFDVLDSKDEEDFVARVEPSSQGGKKMADRFKELLEGIV